MLEKDLQIVSEGLRVKFAQIAERASSPVEVGTGREQVVREFLNTHLPASWETGSGFIHDTFGGRGKQIDVVVNNDSILKPLPYDAGKGLYFIESVGLAIAVKSTLDKAALEDAVENLLSVKSLRRSHVIGETRYMTEYEKGVVGIVP